MEDYFLKVLVKELENQGKRFIDKSHNGSCSTDWYTPDAVYALLHGLEFDGVFNYIAPQRIQ